ncbi:MAG: CGNR zinc finger domain-containing protein [Pseudomonadota bacterium]
MSYSTGHPIRLVGGRLALDFVNTADWSGDGQIVHEKIVTQADIGAWLDRLDIDTPVAGIHIPELLAYRLELRHLFLDSGDPSILNAARGISIASAVAPKRAAADQPLHALLAVSALSILMDERERKRLKMCPGNGCGWLFIDETKNARRTWCSMETCGNRAKAARHYARSKASTLQRG